MKLERIRMSNINAPRVVMTVRDFREKARNITGDNDLSESGKKKKLDEVTRSAELYKPQALDGLRQDWRLLRQASSSREARYKEAERIAAQSWDYATLQYEGLAAQSAVRQAQDIEEVKQLYKAASSSGNLARARAWSEVAPGVVLERFQGGNALETNRVIHEMRANLEKLTTTPEMKAISSEQETIARDALELLSVTKEVGDYYEPQSWGLGEFENLAVNVSVSQRFEPETQRFVTTVDVGDEPARRERSGLR